MESFESTTTLAVLTPPGRGAIATVGVRGPRAVEIVAACFRRLSGRPVEAVESLSQTRRAGVGRIAVGHFRGLAGPGEELVVGLIGPDEVEVHCHGGSAAVAAVVAALAEQGAQQITWQEWTARDESDLIAAEARVALAAAHTERTAAILLDQYRGALREAVHKVIGRLAGSDPDSQHKVPRGGRDLQEVLARAELGLHLTKPWQIVIAGPTNVGKSSLINALLGYERAIVFDQPGTTRDVLTAATAIDGWPVELADTAGLRESADEIEAEGVARAQDRVANADLVLLVTDLSRTWEPEDQRWLAVVKGLQPLEKVLIVHNKADLADESEIDDRPPGMRLSALTEAGIRELLAEMTQRLVPDPPPRGAAVPFTDRQVGLLRDALAALSQGNIVVCLARLQEIIGAATNHSGAGKSRL